MIAEGFRPDFPKAVLTEAASAKAQPASAKLPARDLRQLLWSSIDNTESRDLDQIEWAEKLSDGRIRVRVGIADVDATVASGSATDQHAAFNTTSVYPGGPVFPMLPETFSTDLTSLNANGDRASVIIEYVVDAQGGMGETDIYLALVRNQAKLSYDRIGQWLEGKAPSPGSNGTPAGL